MRKIIVCEFITLDGVIQSPESDFKYDGWFFGYTEEECGAGKGCKCIMAI